MADVRAAAEGDADAFARLYDVHVGALFAFCASLTGDRGRARELVQDTFVRAWEALATFRGESAFGTWLHRIAANLAFAEARSARRRAQRVAIEADFDALVSESPIAAAATADDDLAAQLDLGAAVQRLPRGARTVFLLHDLAGYTHAEIGEMLGIAEGTCKAHLFRARRLLRGMLDR
ncbi:MAG: RNA polymerase sigma factor [Gemmatimonadaceae bacterium]|nr:RNA polymerase sigma factor [Gemmatimonadaceae bacterium]